MGWFFGAFFVAILAGYGFVRWKARPRFFAHAEYWVYTRDERVPDREELLTRLMAQNPYARRGRNPLGTAEGMMLTDVRTHIAVVLRSKNAHVFRPDLADKHSNVTADFLAALSESKAFVKLRYVSERPLIDRRHLQFLIHAADAVVDLCQGLVIYDPILERFIAPATLKAQLKEKLDQTSADRHVEAIWDPHSSGGHAESRGMVKVGLPEIVTETIEGDERNLAVDVVRAAAESIWETGEIPTPWIVHAFDDDFRIEPEKRTPRQIKVRVYRMAPL